MTDDSTGRERLTPTQAVSVLQSAVLLVGDGHPLSDRSRELAVDALGVIAEAVVA